MKAKAKAKRSALALPRGVSRTFVHKLGRPRLPATGGANVWMDDRTAEQLRTLQAKLGLASEGDVIAWLCIQVRAIGAT